MKQEKTCYFRMRTPNLYLKYICLLFSIKISLNNHYCPLACITAAAHSLLTVMYRSLTDQMIGFSFSSFPLSSKGPVNWVILL